jgi:ubiquinone/menaquinone biosynthesis C-methylase UbiE
MTENRYGVRDYFERSVDEFDRGYQDVRRRYHLIVRYRTILEEFGRLGRRPQQGCWLDAGCGPGLLACAIGEKGYHVVGIDFTAKMIEHCIQNAERARVSSRVTFSLSDVESLPFRTASLGGLVSSGLIEYLADPQVAFAEFARVLRPEAPFILTFNNILSPFRWFSGPAKIALLRCVGRQMSVVRNRGYSCKRSEQLLSKVGLD